jgi:hypothetical protein
MLDAMNRDSLVCDARSRDCREQRKKSEKLEALKQLKQPAPIMGACRLLKTMSVWQDSGYLALEPRICCWCMILTSECLYGDHLSRLMEFVMVKAVPDSVSFGYEPIRLLRLGSNQASGTVRSVHECTAGSIDLLRRISACLDLWASNVWD